MQLKSSIKFLDSYEKRDRLYYFGRGEEIKALYDKIKDSRITVVYGSSGTGKTSLIQCGLANEFSSSDWFEIIIRKRRGISLNASTFFAIQEKAKTTIPSPADINQINDDYLTNALKILYRDYFRSIYLLYDQFEELFIQGEDDEKIAFFSFLKKCNESNIDLKILLIIREEWLGSLDEFVTKDLNLMDNRFRLDKLSKIPVIDVIKDILGTYGITSFEKVDDNNDPHYDTAYLVYDNIKGGPINKPVDLPYLQVYLERLIKILPDNITELKKQYVDSIGRLDDVLSVFIEEEVKIIADKIEDSQQCKVGDIWAVLNALVSVDGTKQGLKTEDLKRLLINV
jgi:hypothetical protein